MRKGLIPTVLFASALSWALALPFAGLAQVTPSPSTPAPAAPAPVSPAPAAPAPAAPAPVPAPAPEAAPVPPAAAAPAAPNPAVPGLSGGLPGPAVGETVQLEAKPVLVLRGEASWDDGFEVLKKSFATLAAEAEKGGVKAAGRPRVHFTKTDDSTFQYSAMLPIAETPAATSRFGQGVAVGLSPAGKALRFASTGAYDDIDSVYEAITAYLDEKKLKARGDFVEEYIGDLKTSDDPGLEMNIFVIIE